MGIPFCKKRKPKQIQISTDLDTYTDDLETEFEDDDLDYVFSSENDQNTRLFLNQNEFRSIDSGSYLTETSITNISMELTSAVSDSVNVYINGETCNICANNFDNEEFRPTVLPCGHILCYWCVKNLGQQYHFLMIKCPLDREIHGCRRMDKVLNIRMDMLDDDAYFDANEEFSTENEDQIGSQSIAETDSVAELPLEYENYMDRHLEHARDFEPRAGAPRVSSTSWSFASSVSLASGPLHDHSAGSDDGTSEVFDNTADSREAIQEQNRLEELLPVSCASAGSLDQTCSETD